MSLWSSYHRQKGRGLLPLLLLILLVPPIMQIDFSTSSAQTSEEFDNARVAVYQMERFDNFSCTACYHLFEWMNASVELVNGTQIQQGILRSFDLLVLPAFGPSSYERDLTPIGKESIRQFLATGGSLFSVCRGTEFAVISLGIIDATLHYVGPAGVQCHDTHNGQLALSEMQVNRESTGPDLSDEPDSYMVFTTGASYFEVHGEVEIIPLLSYADSGLPGVIAFRYGQGTVILSSPHPEFEEGNDRDGLSQDHVAHWPTYQNLQDPDSEWNFLLKVSCWLVETSPGVPFEMHTGLLILVFSGFIITLVVTSALEIRKRES